MACITIDLDHDIIDGAPGARFVADLVEMIENATVLRNPVSREMGNTVLDMTSR